MLKILAAVVVAGVALWGLERFAMTPDGKLFGLEFEKDAEGKPKLGVAYAAAGATIATAALATGWAVHKVSGGRLPKGLALAGK